MSSLTPVSVSVPVEDAGCAASVERLLKAGYTWVVEADLKSYFETIGHERLMAELQQRIADSRVLDLIEGFLKQQILEDLKRWTPERARPKGR